MRTYFIFFFFVLLFTKPSFAQGEIQLLEAKIDSLKTVLASIPENDIERFEVLDKLTLELFDLGNREYVDYAEHYRALALELQSDKHLRMYYSSVMNDIGFVDTVLYERRSLEGEAYLMEQKDTISLIELYYSRSTYYFDELGESERSYGFLQRSLELSQEVGYDKILPKVWLGKSLYFLDSEKTEQALNFLDKTINSQYVNPYELAYALEMKAGILTESNFTDSVVFFLETALEIHKNDMDMAGMQFAYAALGDFHLKKQNIQLAKEYYEKVKPLAAINQCDCTPLSTGYQKIGNFYFVNNQLDSAASYAYETLRQINFEDNYKHEINNGSRQKAYLLLINIYKKKVQYDSAFYYLEQYHMLTDKNDKLALGKISEELNVQYETEKKDDEISDLTSETKALMFRSNAYLAGMLAVGIIGVISLFFFLRLRKKNELITQQKSQLEQLNLTKDRIFAIIGHDMRKPALAFRGIGKKVNYLLKKQDYDTLNLLGNEIEKDAFALNKLTDNLLNWALTQKDVMPYNPQLLEVAPMVEDVLLIFNLLAKEKQLQLASDVPIGLRVNADRNALLTIIRNLVDNAIKYTPQGGEVRVKAVQQADQVLLQVEDTGVGMPEDKLKDIFLLREDKSETGTAGEKGTGLGLHLIYELVKLNKGEIGVESEVDKGTRFNVFLPML